MFMPGYFWNMFRTYMSGATVDNVIDKIKSSRERATRAIAMPVRAPVLDLKYLNLRTAHRRAQRLVRKTEDPAD